MKGSSSVSRRILTLLYWGTMGMVGLAGTVLTLITGNEPGKGVWQNVSVGRLTLASPPFFVGLGCLVVFWMARKDANLVDRFTRRMVAGREELLGMMAVLAVFAGAACWIGFGSQPVGSPGWDYIVRLRPVMGWMVIAGVFIIAFLALLHMETSDGRLFLVATGLFWLAGVAYIWVMTTGTMTFRTRDDYHYYDMLGDAFLRGQASLIIQPDPGILALPDPYTIEIDRRIPYPYDIAMYQGKYYLAWGPAPGLAAAIVKLFLRVVVEDQYLVLGFIAGTLAFIILTLLAVRKICFRDLPWGLASAGILATGLANPVPWLLGRPSVYEASIAGGQFFLMGGIYFALTALSGECLSNRRLAAAGVFWSLAGASRINLIPALGFLALLTAWRVLRGPLTPGKTIKSLLSFGVPVLVGAICLLLYNYTRFGSLFETGMQFQLNGLNWGVRQSLASPAYILPNVYNYLIRPLVIIPSFPFIVSQAPKLMTYPAFVGLVEGYHWEENAGVLSAVPFVWLALFALWKLRTKAEELNWMTTWLMGAWILELAPLAVMVGCTMRYHFDMWPTLSLLAMVGGWHLYRWAGLHRVGWAALVFIVIVTLVSVGVGMLLGVTSYYLNFENGNPALFAALRGLFR